MRLIDADALKETLEPKPQYCYGKDYDPSAPPYIALDAVMNTIDRAPTVMQWIPVTERMPKMLEGHFYSADVLATVICTDGSTQIRVMTYGLPIMDNNTGWFDDEGWDYVVTAWMPLPEPYQI